MTLIGDFREAMSALASAVYIVTGRDLLGRPRGFTATSVTAHSVGSELVVVSVDHAANSHDTLASARQFGLSILGPGQARQAELFASKRPDKFEHVAWEWRHEVPVLTDATAFAACRIVAARSHLDHTALVATIESSEVADSGATLIYWRHRFSDHPQSSHHQRRKPKVATASAPTREELIDRATAMVPDLRNRARDTERSGTLPDDTVAEMREAGFFKVFQPSRYGGWEMGWGIQAAIARVLGRACGSTGWISSVVSTHSAMVGRMPEAAQEEVWGDDEHAIIATGSARVEGNATDEGDHYTLTGAWRFASGVDHCEWAMVPAPIEGVDAVGPAAMGQFLLRRDEFEIIDDWDVSGLRGTGSKMIKVADTITVPSHRTIGFLEMLDSNPPGGDVNDGYVYSMELRPYFGTLLLGPILGTAEGALHDYLESTRTRIGAIFGNRIADSKPVQLSAAESSAQIAACGLVADANFEMLHQRGEERTPLTPKERVESMRDRAFIARQCVDAVHRLVRQMGASGLSNSNPVQRHFRDLSAMSAQIGLNWDRNAGTYGSWALGIPTGDSAIDGEARSTDEASDAVG